MKASTIRLLVWTGTALAAGFCVWQFVDFVALGGRKTRTAFPNTDDIRKTLRTTDAPPTQLRKQKEAYEVIRQVNLSGVKPKPPAPVETRPAEEDTKVKINPLTSVVGLKGVWIDNGDPSKSVAIVFWIDPQISPEDRKKNLALMVGTWLPKPYEKTFRLKRVEARKAFFEHAKEDGSFTELPPLTLGEARPPLTASRPFRMDAPTASRPIEPAVEYAPPAETLKISESEYLLSEKDRDEAKNRGLDMIGRDVHTAPYLDPKTKKPEGIIVKSIRQSSLAAKLGIKENDIVRGVNNSPIRTNSDIYAFAKANPEVKEVAVSIERFGRTIQIVYRLP
jgi:hypothetical protein